MTQSGGSDSAGAARAAGGAGGGGASAPPPPASRRPPPSPAAGSAAATFASLPLGELAKRTAVVLAVAVAFAAGVWFVLDVSQIILWLVIAAVLAMALEPAVAWLTRHHLKRGPAAVLVSVAAVVILAAVVAVLAVPLVNQARQLIDNLPGYIHDFTKPGSPFAGRRDPVPRRRAPQGARSQGPHRSSPAPARRRCMRCAACSRCWPQLVSILTMTVLLLIEGPRTWTWALSFVAAERRPVAQDLGGHLLSSVGGYVRGNLFISLIAGVAAYIVMLIVGVPFALPLAVAVAVLDLVPLVGATLGAIICVIVAAAGGGWLPGVIIAAYFIVYQQVENNLIQTTVYSRTVALSPLAVLVASLFGAAVAGIVGVLLAIPVAATVAIALVEIRALRTGDEPTEALEILEGLDESEPPAPAG